MTLKSVRTFLCCVFTVIFVTGFIIFASSILLSSTLANENYIQAIFNHSSFKEDCTKNLENQYAVLEAESGIPSGAFTIIENSENSNGVEEAVKRLFSDSDTSLNYDAKVEELENYIKEYLEGNNYEYSKDYVHNTALKAAQIYSNSYGLNNTASITDFINSVKNESQTYSSFGILLILFSLFLTLAMYSNKTKFLGVLMCNLSCCGFASFFIGLFGLIFGFGTNLNVYPTAFIEPLTTALNCVYIIAILIGAIITIPSVIACKKIYKSL